jgi:hypothetical protein
LEQFRVAGKDKELKTSGAEESWGQGQGMSMGVKVEARNRKGLWPHSVLGWQRIKKQVCEQGMATP